MLLLSDDGILRHEGWPGDGTIVHGFTTRLCTACKPQGFRPRRLKQVHGAEVVVASCDDGPVATGDALVTDRPGLQLIIATADCLPVLLYSPSPRPVIAAVHCGWRGLRARVVQETVRLMAQKYDVRQRAISACFGPSIETSCYEIGPDVEVPHGAESIRRDGDRLYLDLEREATLQLTEVGVSPENVLPSGFCTRCRPDLFYSYRRDGRGTGRMYNFIGVSTSDQNDGSR